VRETANIGKEIGRHGVGPVTAQGQCVDEAVKTLRDRRNDLIVPPDRGKQADDMVRYPVCELAPLALPHEGVELEPVR
jgi:hypothetical protein